MNLLPTQIKNSRILISPLDWGMGHTTRCVALIKKLIEQQNEIFFAGNEAQINFIKREFPQISTTFLKGYGIRLDNEKSTYWQVIKQLNKIRRAIKSESTFADNFVETNKIDYIISDNRYGLRSAQCKSIFITHQLSLQIPYGKNLIDKNIKTWVEKFDCCWIPDFEKNGLCGALAEAELAIPKLFIGHLSRFEKQEETSKYKYLVIVSGPEPTRSQFAKKMVDYLALKKEDCAIVGINGSQKRLDFFEKPTTPELQKLIHQAETILSRAGYTTIMELAALGKQCILIPTPGQYEQEYLAALINLPNFKFVSEKTFFS